MDRAQLPGYVRAYTGPSKAENEWPDIGLERRVVIHRNVTCYQTAQAGGRQYAVHEECQRPGTGEGWALCWGAFNLKWKEAIELGKNREDALLGGHSPSLSLLVYNENEVPGSLPLEVANESYRMADQPTAERYIELSIVVGGVSFSGRLYRD